MRSDPYDAMLAGLATLAGPLHGGASQQAYEMLAVAERDGAPPALNDVLREQGRLPGFGHAVYKSGDPRFGALLALAEPLLSATGGHWCARSWRWPRRTTCRSPNATWPWPR